MMARAAEVRWSGHYPPQPNSFLNGGGKLAAVGYPSYAARRFRASGNA